MDEVNETGVEIVITKRNRPVAKLVPVTGELRPFVGRSRGVIQISDQDLLAPVGDDWEVDADL
jgi:antitoxin (DNA-binding transcriptional repressor) of toxin-antitoxin stability system